MTGSLDVHQVSMAYDDKTVVRSVSFHLQDGEIGCLLGPSGCGKTTLLRAIAGFEPVTGGRIELGGRRLVDDRRRLPPDKRRVGMVFQDFALFPHLDVRRNIAFGLRNWTHDKRYRRVDELLSLVGLSGYGPRYPHELSGGQQQRVALARAMAPKPDILLMDEPFSGIDAEFREQLASQVRDVLKAERMTAILVTHDQFEAFAMADAIGVLGGGQLHQWSTPYDLYHEPADLFVADFIGEGTFLEASICEDGGCVHSALGVVRDRLPPSFQPGDRVRLLVRPDDVIHDDASELKLPVLHRSFRGASWLYRLQLPSGEDVLCLAPSHHVHAGQLAVRLDFEHIKVFRID
jgi:iron(III) transport system ATP-binding protein